MPFPKRDDLPESVTNVLPAHAQDIYKEVFNSAWKEYKDASDRNSDDDREVTAHKVAWSAVKQKYEKGDDGNWHEKKD